MFFTSFHVGKHKPIKASMYVFKLFDNENGEQQKSFKNFFGFEETIKFYNIFENSTRFGFYSNSNFII
jgi:hypothetical protein